ncbi:MAG TPA: monovalent cation/H+ antiporter complex subunit F [Candidatus Limnocylindrales bacterium]|nr:monovalent cation/H+ antiporter complex subunit F [Candidatus Limnocylindrales bacterium]
MPDLILVAAFGWSTILLGAGGVVLLRASDTLHRLLALDVLASIVIILLTTLSYVHGVSYYVDAALGLALLSFAATLVAAPYITRRRRAP